MGLDLWSSSGLALPRLVGLTSFVGIPQEARRADATKVAEPPSPTSGEAASPSRAKAPAPYCSSTYSFRSTTRVARYKNTPKYAKSQARHTTIGGLSRNIP